RPVPHGGIFRRPEALRLGPHHEVAAIAFQLAAVPTVDQRVIGPGARAQHGGGVGDDHGQGHKRLALSRKGDLAPEKAAAKCAASAFRKYAFHCPNLMTYCFWAAMFE